jgi:hypothetical protein
LFIRVRSKEIGPTAELFADPHTAEFSQFIGSELCRIEAKNPACRDHSNQSQPGGL